jgi:hypothetical protein
MIREKFYVHQIVREIQEQEKKFLQEQALK